MTGNRVTPEVYERLLAAYRAVGPKHSIVATEVGVTYRTARRGWDIGWPDAPWGEAIRVRIAREQEAARARLTQQAVDTARVEGVAAQGVREAERKAQAQVDAEASRAEEAKMVRVVRVNAMGALQASNHLLRGILQQVQETAAGLQTGALKFSTPDALSIFLDRILRISAKSTEIAHQSMVMERLNLGDPAAMLNSGFDVPDMTPNEMVEEIERAREAVERAKALGLIVLSGGKSGAGA